MENNSNHPISLIMDKINKLESRSLFDRGKISILEEQAVNDRQYLLKLKDQTFKDHKRLKFLETEAENYKEKN